MKVNYIRPELDADFDVLSEYNFLKVNSLEHATRVQERILDISDQIAKIIESYELPEDIDGDAVITFRGYEAKMDGKWFSMKTVRSVGFPSASIVTDLGTSSLSMHPNKDSYIQQYKNGLEIQISGGGLADKVAKELLPKIENIFDSKLTKTETFGNYPPPGYLSKRMVIPI